MHGILSRRQHIWRTTGGFVALASLSEDAVDAIRFGVEAVEADLMLDEDQGDDAGGHAQGQAEHADGGVQSVAGQVAEGDGQVVAKHVPKVAWERPVANRMGVFARGRCRRADRSK